MPKTRVFIVDDSAVTRHVLKSILDDDANVVVTGVASDPIFAMRKMEADWPDVIVLDLEMPRMDGISFLKQIMATRPTPVVVCSAHTEGGNVVSMRALEAGAVSIVTKPKIGLKQFLIDASADIVYAVKAAAQANMKTLKRVADLPPVTKVNSADAVLPLPVKRTTVDTNGVVAIGTSTGGTVSLELILKALPNCCPGLVIVQHMPENFTALFADRLNMLSDLEVKEAKNGDRVVSGVALIAPGGKHMLLKRSGPRYFVEVRDGPLVNRHRPSVDVLFRSVADAAGKNALGIIMTGMGNDGARGLKEMRNVGAQTLGQNEETCVVYGMPKEAENIGAVQRSVALDAIASEIMQFADNRV